MKIRRILTLIFLTAAIQLQAQNNSDTIEYSLNARINAGGGSYAPFLSVVNQYDRHSITPNSISAWGTVNKNIKASRSFDYGFGMEMDANLSKTEKRFFPGELYVQGKAYFINAYAGMKREVFGNQDPELSSGGMLWSQNSRPMPKIAIESNGFIPVPFTKGYLEVKGGLSHGWFTDSTVTTNTLLHHKYAYFRVGGSFPINISYGIQHVCQWAGTSPSYGKSQASWDNYKRIFFGYGGSSDAAATEQYNALGNHIISQNVGLDINLSSANISLYWQDISEDPPVFLMRMNKAYNVEDGLWGMSVRLHDFKPFSAFVLEYMNSTDQSGPWHDLDGVIYGGTDSYYNNGVYPNGWSFYGMTIGNPWLTSPKYNENGIVSFQNNKVRLYYFSGKGSFSTYSYKFTVAYSQNYGSPQNIFDNCKKQLSYQIEASTPLSMLKSTRVSLALSGDHGKMYGNNFAALLGISYSGLFDY